MNNRSDSSRCARAAAIASLVLAASASQAQVYGLVHAGRSQLELSCNGQTPCDGKGGALAGQVGFKFGGNWAVELGAVFTSGLNAPSGGISTGMDTRSYRVGLAHHYALGKDWTLISRGGLANTESIPETYFFFVGNDSRSRWVGYAGLGLGMRLGKVVSLNLMADFSSAEARFEASNNGPVLNGRGSQRALTFGVGFNL